MQQTITKSQLDKMNETPRSVIVREFKEALSFIIPLAMAVIVAVVVVNLAWSFARLDSSKRKLEEAMALQPNIVAMTKEQWESMKASVDGNGITTFRIGDKTTLLYLKP